MTYYYQGQHTACKQLDLQGDTDLGFRQMLGGAYQAACSAQCCSAAAAPLWLHPQQAHMQPKRLLDAAATCIGTPAARLFNQPHITHHPSLHTTKMSDETYS